MENKNSIPVTVLTGFLGSGKTTLLNKILSENHGKKIAVIENEFGEVGVDNELVIGADEEIFEMNNGCICCTVRGDLIRILDQLLKRKDKLDYIIVETTGMANPAPVAQTFWVDDEIKDKYSLDAIVTIVDAKHVWLHIDESAECKEQIAFADVILLNKTDLVSAEELVKLEKRIKSMNANAKIHKTQNADIDLEHILNIQAFDLDAKIELNPEFAVEEYPYEWMGIYDFADAEYQINMKEGPDPSFDLCFVKLADTSEAVITKAQKQAIKTFAMESKTLKAEKFINTNNTLNTLLIENESQTFYFRPHKAGIYAVFTQHGPEEFNLELTVKNTKNGVPTFENVEPTLTDEFAHNHEHDDIISSVGIEDTHELSIQKVNEWISYLLREKAIDIFRMKGILNIAGNDDRFVFQGVHMLFDAKADRKWKPGETRKNQIIFIGKNLNREELLAKYKKCIVK
ncbi:MAG: GTP-binding protein [Bacteroidia bacterium]|nr:GTP-binding protein [Bacteroidia bacterium]